MADERETAEELQERLYTGRGSGSRTIAGVGPGALAALLVPAFVLFSTQRLFAQQPASKWDATLPGLQLAHVRVEGHSLFEAWTQASGDLMVRSVLCLTDTSPGESPFSFQADACTAQDLFNAFTAAYPDLTWTQDDRTGVIWLHPKSLLYRDILTPELTVPTDELGIPAYEGAVLRLSALPGPDLRMMLLGSGFSNTFNYAVDIPRGTYSARDLLNACCAANPTKAFCVDYNTQRGFVSVSPANLADSDHHRPLSSPRPGALRFWEAEIGPTGGAPPTAEEIKARLADPSPRVRWAARNYVQAMIWAVPFDRWAAETPGRDQALWVCIGMTSVLVKCQDQGATHVASITRMKAEATPDFLTSGEPGLAVLTAMELCRLTKDKSYLQIVSKRKFGKGGLSGIVSDAFRIARLSQGVREALQELGTDRLRAGDERLAELTSRPSVFGFALRLMPNAPRIEWLSTSGTALDLSTRPTTRKAIRIELPPTTSQATSGPARDAKRNQ
jgi:hypothetical protein